ncbi:hypothetical protein LCGC14_2056330, partial [marine sediment metagenome]
MKKHKEKVIKLSPELEQSLMKATILGLAPMSTLSPEELGKTGRATLKAVKCLISNGASIPLTLSAVAFASKKIFGGKKKEIIKYIHQLEELELGDDAMAIIQTVRDKDVLVQLVNEAGDQLREGISNFLRFDTMLAERRDVGGNKIKSLGEMVDQEWPAPPKGPAI